MRSRGHPSELWSSKVWSALVTTECEEVKLAGFGGTSPVEGAPFKLCLGGDFLRAHIARATPSLK